MRKNIEDVLLSLSDREARRRFLEVFGEQHSVRVVQNTAEALSVLEGATRYSVVVLDDIESVDPPGFDAIGAIRTLAPDAEVIPIIDPDPATRIHVIRQGAFSYAMKPVDFEELAVRIRMVLQQVELRRQQQASLTLLNLSAEIQQTSDLEHIGKRICETAVELFGADHSAIAVFDSAYQFASVIAEYPEIGAIGNHLAVVGVPFEERLIELKGPIFIPDVLHDTSLGPNREVLTALGIHSTLIIPVVSGEDVIASFSLDFLSSAKDFPQEDVQVCINFSSLVSSAIQRARFDQAARRQQAVQSSIMAISSALPFDERLEETIRQAVGLLGAESGGIYRYFPERESLYLIADFQTADRRGTQLKVGEGMAGRLIKSAEEYLIVDDYNNWPGKAKIFDTVRSFGAVLEVKLVWQGEPIGILYVDDKVGRRFTEDDARLLSDFAGPAAIQIMQADTYQSEQQKLRLLEQLSQAHEEIIQSLGQDELPEVFGRIASRARDLLKAETSAILLVEEPGFLTLKASVGHAKGRANVNKKLSIRSAPKSGLTGHIAFEQKAVNLSGEALRKHPNVKRDRSGHTPSGYCHSLLAMPLFQQKNGKRELVGLIRADNKLTEIGDSLPTFGFRAEDEWILSSFAQTAVVAIDLAQKVALLKRQENRLDRLINSSPVGIVANDFHGVVTAYNQAAEDVLGYSAAEIQRNEIKIFQLFEDPEVPRSIGRQLRRGAAAQTVEQEAVAMHKDGTLVPVRIYSAWVSDEMGKKVGVVGHFEPLAQKREFQKRLELIQSANEILSGPEPVDLGLERLSALILEALDVSYCRFGLADGPQRFSWKTGRVWAAGGPAARPLHGERQLLLRQDRTFQRFLRGREKSKRYRASHYLQRRFLERYSQDQQLDRPLHTLVRIPIRQGDQLSGLLEIGEARKRKKHVLSQGKMNLATAAAEQVFVLLERRRLADETGQRKKFLEAIYVAQKNIAGQQNYQGTLEALVSEARSVFKADSAALWPFDKVKGQLVPDEFISVGIPATAARYFKEQPPMPGRTTESVLAAGWIGVDDVSDPGHKFISESTRKNLAMISVRSFQAIRLEADGDFLGVLFINYTEQRRFTDSDQSALRSFSALVSLTLRNARLLRNLDLSKQVADLFAEVMALGDYEASLQAVADGAREVLGCGPVLLYGYDPHIERFIYPPKMSGVQNADAVMEKKTIPEDSIVRKMIGRDEILWVQDVGQHPDFQDTRFAREEGTRSAVAIPLKAPETLGLLFINYYQAMRFTDDLREEIQTIANKAKVALRNALMYAEIVRKSGLLQVTNRLALHISNLGDPDQIISKTVDLISEAYGHYYAGIFMVDRHREWAVLRAGRDRVGEQLVAEGHRLRVGPGSMIGMCIHTREPVISSDTSRAEHYFPNPALPDTRSEIALPLVAGDEVLGALSVQSLRSDALSRPEEIEVLQSVASQVAIAIKKAQLLAQTKEREQALRALQKAGNAIARPLYLDDTLDAFVTEALNVLGERGTEQGCFSHIFLLEEDELRCKRSSDPGMHEELQHLEIDLARQGPGQLGIAGRAFVEDTLINAGEVDRHPDYVPTNPETRSQISISIRTDDGKLGVFSIEHPAPNAFGEIDEMILGLLAGQAGIAIREAQAYESKQAQLKAQEAMVDFSQKLLNTASLDEVYRRAGQEASALLGTDYTLTVTKNRFGELVLRGGVGWDETLFGRSLQADAEGSQTTFTIEQAKRGERYVVVKDYAAEHRFKPPPCVRELCMISGASAPIIGENDRIIGALLVHTRSHREFSERDLSLLCMIASQLSVAILSATQKDQILRSEYQDTAMSYLELMGITATSWWHDVLQAAVNIHDNMVLMRQRISNGKGIRGNDLEIYLSRIDHEVNAIKEQQYTAPLEYEKGDEEISIASLIRLRLKEAIQKAKTKADERWDLNIGDNIVVVANKELLRRALDVLLNNAIESMAGKKCRLDIFGREYGDFIQIEVRDYGTGIPAEFLEKVFRERLPSDKGLGIGLITARQIFRLYAGDLWVQSTGPQGTTMAFKLPKFPLGTVTEPEVS